VRGIRIDIGCLLMVLFNHLYIGWFVRVEDGRGRIVSEMKNFLSY
jgi:hypothetical protein